MNQQKIGGFLKELRKEKELTQEELAEKFNVSSRSVSRWETGHNMPDIDVLIELADFYDVSINEIIHGERNNMNNEIKNELKQVAEYATVQTKKIRNKINFILLISVIVMCVCYISFGQPSDGGFLYGIVPEIVCDVICWTSIIVCFILIFLLYFYDFFEKRKKDKNNR